MSNAESPFAALNPVAYLDGSISPRPVRSRPRTVSGSDASNVRIVPTDRAIQVVTDFTWEQPVTIAIDRTTDDALRETTVAGVHALLVMQADIVTGLITYFDIQAFDASAAARAGTARHEHIEVIEIMTPWERVVTSDWHMVGAAQVAELVTLFECTSATHAVMVEHGEQGGTFVRGIASRPRLERQLRHSIPR
jgi:CBS domain-containing protein